MRRLVVICILLLFIGHINAQVVENPVFDRTDTPEFRVQKVEVNKDTTFVYCLFSAEAGSWANISKETRLKDCLTGKLYSLLRSKGFPYAPEKRFFQFANKYVVILCFPEIDKTTTKFDLIESENGGGFNIYGINLQSQNEKSVFLNSLEHAKALSNKADFYSLTGNHNKAIELEEQSMKIRKAYLGCKSPMYATSVMNLAFYYSKSGNYEKAITYGVEDLNLCKELIGTKNETYGISLTNLASYYNSFGKYPEAESYERKAVELFKMLYGKNHQQYANSLSGLAQILCSQGRYNEALEKEEEALEIREVLFGKESYEYAMSLHSLSLCYSGLGDIPNAINCTTKALEIKRNTIGTHDPNYLMSLNNLASFYSMKEDYSKAANIEEEALSLCKDVYGYSHPEYAKILGNLGAYYLRIGKTENANQLLDSAKQLDKQIYGEKSKAYAISLNNMSQLYSINQNYNKAISYVEEALRIMNEEDPQYITLLSNIASYYAATYDYKQAKNYIQHAAELLKKYITSEYKGLNSENKYLLWQNNHSIIDDLFPYYVAKSKDSLALSNLFDAFLFSKNIVWKKDFNTTTWRDIQKNLKDNDIVVEFINSFMNDTTRFYALTIKKDQQFPKMTELFNDTQLNDSLINSSSKFEKNIKIGKLLWKPLEKELKGINNIYFTLTHVLTVIPIEYLPINREKYYSDLYSMYRLSSSLVLANSPGKARYSKAVLFGGLNYESLSDNTSSTKESKNRAGYEQLFNTRTEVSEIYNLLQDKGCDVSTFTDSEGTEQRFRNLSKGNMDILHLATHGMYNDTNIQNQEKQDEDTIPINLSGKFFYQSEALSNSFLVFANANSRLTERTRNDMNDGIITALDISNMDFSHTDLVALSACESGLGVYGTDDGILGLQRGFKIAGVKTILMSLNKVDDEATKILMVEFYRNLMSGKTKLQSLKDAQKYLRQVDNGKYDDPKYWASFIMLDGLN